MDNIQYSLTDDSPLQLFVAKHRRTLSNTAATDSRNSSLNRVWDEDYFDASDTEFGDLSFEAHEPITPPPAAALTTRPYPRSIPITDNEASFPARQTRTHQRSLTSLLPFRSPMSRGNSKSPERPPNKLHKEKDIEEVGFMATLTGDRDGIIKVADKNKGGLAGWFSGTSAPVFLGPLIAEDEPYSPSTTPRSPSPSSKVRKRPQIQTLDSASTPSKTPATASSIFGFFSPKKALSPQSPQTIQLPSNIIDNDEFLTLDIQTALFPTGHGDPFSPAAFKNLQQNAEGTILKLQTAYKLRTLSFRELKEEKDAQAEELEEAETRAQCLRNQLEDLARRVAEQDQAMEELALQLANEKLRRAEEKEAREKSIALVKASREFVEEDLGIATASKHWRHSSESDTDSAASVFSRSRSPTSTIHSHSDFDNASSTNESTPEILQASFGRVVSARDVWKEAQRPRMEKQRSTFEKMMGGMVDAKPGVVESEMGGMGLESGCRNCQGKEASVAWDTVGLLRAENRGLKDRVGALESAVEGALDMCAGMIRP